MSYYDDLSNCSSRNDAGSDEDDWSEESNREKHTVFDSTNKTAKNESELELESKLELDRLWRRSVIHLDIDCFYCQCEEIDRNLRNVQPPRPLAIGQKHIIVTSNYEARKYGVKKLQLREAAMAVCPDLWIVEGSDLEQYRRHSRSVYDAFRSGLQKIAAELEDCSGSVDDNQSSQQATILSLPSTGGGGAAAVPKIPVQKGSGMDEMLADLTWAVDKLISSHPTTSGDDDSSVYIYGETATSSTAVLVEDQTGATTTVSYNNDSQTQKQTKHMNHHHHLSNSRGNVHHNRGTDQDRQCCISRLQAASQLASKIRQHIFDETQFITTIGISVSPLLAKLATDLHKPDSINLLYPWRAAEFMPSMPLRKLNQVGYGTIKALDQCLELHATMTSSRPKFWTIQDLLNLPRSNIVECLTSLKSFSNSGSQEHCDLIIHRCRGLDETEVIDDQGGLSKTVSVENSFRRGTIRNMESVWNALDHLLERLPRLLRDRKSWSNSPDLAFPTTIRLTARLVDERLRSTKRRPFVTRSSQRPLEGQHVLQDKDLTKQSEMLKHAVIPLVRQLLGSLGATEIDVTRLNIATTNFQDIPIAAALMMKDPKTTLDSFICDGVSVAKTFSSHKISLQSQKPKETLNERNGIGIAPQGSAGVSSSSNAQIIIDNAKIEISNGKGNLDPMNPPRLSISSSKSSPYHHVLGSTKRGSTTSSSGLLLPHQEIDPSVLAELPPDIASEVLRAYPQQKKKRHRIDHFFTKKKTK